MKTSGDVENVLARSLRNENDLLRFQLNDIISREKNQVHIISYLKMFCLHCDTKFIVNLSLNWKPGSWSDLLFTVFSVKHAAIVFVSYVTNSKQLWWQRIELQRLRSHRDVEVSQLVSTATTQLKSEVDQLKGLLQSTSSQLLQALNDKEKLVSEKDQSVRVLEEVRHGAAASEASLRNRLQHFEDMVTKGFAMATTLADSVDAFQRHVLPTFNPSATGKETGESGAARSLTEEVMLAQVFL